MAAQKEWLIKANAKIMGPYTSSEVDDLLRDNRVVAHDEIMKPAGRWHLLRDEEQFRLVLNEVKNRMLTKKVADNTASGTMTPQQEDLIRERAFHAETLLEGINAHREKEAVSAPDQSDPTRDLLKSYASEDNFSVNKDLMRVRTRRFWLGLTLFVVSGIFVALKITKPKNGSIDSRDIHFQELMENGLSAEKIGDYQRALAEYSEARTLRPNDPELLLHLAPLALTYDRQLLQSQRMFKELLDTIKEPNYQKTSYVGLGLIALESHELDVAKDNFEKARRIDADFLAPIANLGVIAFFHDDYRQAEDLFLKALEKGSSDGAIVISLADTYLAEGVNQPGRVKLANAHKVLDEYLLLTHDYQQEVLVEDSRVLSLQGKPTEVARRLETFLDIDPEQTENHVHDWMIYRGRASWGLLLDTLKRVASDMTSSPRLTAALGLAMYRGREKLEGAQLIEQALSQSPHDALIMALAGWIEIKLGRRETGVVNIKQASMESDKFKLPHILMARLCQEDKDFDCARHHWEIVLRLDGRSVEALHGLALAAWSRQDREMAQNELTQLYANDPTYIPYLQLVREIRSTVPNSESK
jgi:tetratricopeptide (TPR) repeat protein